MKHKKLKVTKQMLNESRHLDCSIYDIKKGYCDLHDCCEVCNPKVRFWCNIVSRIEDLQKRIIIKEVTE